jgi:hypothetical protein
MTLTDKIMCEVAVRVGYQRDRCSQEAVKFYFDGYKFRARCKFHSKDEYYNRIIEVTKEEFIVARIMDS